MVRDGDTRKVPSAKDKAKMIGQCILSFHRETIRKRQEHIGTWIEMKEEHRKKHLPPASRNYLVDQLSKATRQRSMTMIEYMRKFNEPIVYKRIVVLPF